MEEGIKIPGLQHLTEVGSTLWLNTKIYYDFYKTSLKLFHLLVWLYLIQLENENESKGKKNYLFYHSVETTWEYIFKFGLWTSSTLWFYQWIIQRNLEKSNVLDQEMEI